MCENLELSVFSNPFDKYYTFDQLYQISITPLEYLYFVLEPFSHKNRFQLSLCIL